MNMPIGLGSAQTNRATALRLDSRRQSFADPAGRCGVLVVDDELEVLEELAATLGRRGLKVLAAGSAEAALAVLRGRRDIATLVSDIRMPVMDGLALAEEALRGRAEADALEVVLITGYASTAQGTAASRLGAFGMLQKPMRGADLARMVQDALARAMLRRGLVSPAALGSDAAQAALKKHAAPAAGGNGVARGSAARDKAGSWPPSRPTGTLYPPVAWTRRPTAEGGLPQIVARQPAPLQREAQPWPAEPPLNPAFAAEALLHTLAQRLDAAGNGIEAIARDLRGPLGDLLRAAPRVEDVAGEPRRLLALLDDLMDIAALEAGTASPQPAPISAHGLLGAVASRLSALGLRCGRRIILQPDADPAFQLDTPRLVRAMALLAFAALGARPAGGKAELSIDAGAGQARLDLVIRPADPGSPDAGSPGADRPTPPQSAPQLLTERRLPIAIASRLLALQGGRLDAWTLPEGGLRARLLIRGG